MHVYYAMRAIAVFTLGFAAFLTIRAALADFEFQHRTPESVAKAVQIAPGNVEYLQLRALQLDYDGVDSTELLERAAALQPMSSAPRIRLGLAAESRGDFRAAEKWLTEGAHVDHQFEPVWTLANFYFRRGDAQEFWTWIRSALEISYGDRRPAFDLCWRMSNDGGEIFRRAIPEQHDVLASYLNYLLEEKRTGAIAPVARKLASDADRRELLLSACDALIAAQSAQAWPLWRAMGYADVSFESPRVNRAFDWQRIESPGVVHLEIDQPRSMHRITLNGSQPESCDLLKRVLHLEPGRRYVVEWQSQPDVPGIEWRIADQHADLKAGPLEFTAPSEFAPLVLSYRRPQGQVRAEGSLELWNVIVRSF